MIDKYMALRNPKLFGLNVESLFADVQNKSQALQAINLPPLDLEVIGGSAIKVQLVMIGLVFPD